MKNMEGFLRSAPYRSPSFEVSAISAPEKFDDIRRNAIDLWFCVWQFLFYVYGYSLMRPK